MAGGHVAGADRIGVLEEPAELDPRVAADAGVRRPAAAVVAGEGVDDPLEVGRQVEGVQRDAQPVGDAAGVERVGGDCSIPGVRAAAPPGGWRADRPARGGSTGDACRMKTPTHLWPASTSSAAATLESTPPDMATTTRVISTRSRSRRGAARAAPGRRAARVSTRNAAPTTAAAARLDEPHAGGRRAAGGQHVVHDEHPGAGGEHARGASPAGRGRIRGRTRARSCRPEACPASAPGSRPRRGPAPAGRRRESLGPRRRRSRRVARAAPRRGERRRSPSANARGSASSGVMSRNRMPGLGKSGIGADVAARGPWHQCAACVRPPAAAGSVARGTPSISTASPASVSASICRTRSRVRPEDGADLLERHRLAAAEAEPQLDDRAEARSSSSSIRRARAAACRRRAAPRPDTSRFRRG